MNEPDKYECLILDIKEYRDGFFNKRTLCGFISEHLNIIAMPIWEFILLILVIVIITSFY